MSFPATNHVRIGLEEALDQAHAGATLVTAGRRLARTLRERSNRIQRDAGRAAWEAPAILPWSAWLSELWTELMYSARSTPVRLDEEQEALVWERAVADSPGGNGLLQAGATAQAAAGSWNLVHAWRVNPAAIEAAATEDTRAFLDWSRRFESACERGGWIDGARATDHLRGNLGRVTLPERLILAGFDEFTPQQQEFLAACASAGVRISIAEPPAAEQLSVVRTSFPDSEQETAAAARWARSLVESGATGIAVVIRNLAEVRERVERVFAEILDPGSVLPGGGSRGRLFNISASPMLASYPLVHAALLALRLSPGANDFDSASRLIRSPFLGGAGGEWTRRAALDADLRRGANRVSAERIERLAERHRCIHLAAMLGQWRQERVALPKVQSPASWARAFSTLLARLGWPGAVALDSTEYQTVEAWRDLLSAFAGLGTVLAETTYEEAVARLGAMAAARSFQPETEAAPIQILGLLETSGMRFEHLWMAGLDDERWPGPPKPAAFLPVAVQRAFHLPRTSPERELAFARRITGRLLASAPDIVVSYAAREGDSEFGRSPLIADLPRGEVEVPRYPLYPEALGLADLERIEDSTGPPLEQETAAGGTSVFRYQAQCPFRAFAELRLGAKPLEEPAPGLSPSERGTLVHRALEKIWTELRTHNRLCAAGADELGGIVRAAVSDAIAAIGERRREALPPAFAAIEQNRLEKLLGEWLEIEKRRAPFAVMDREEERYAEAGGVRCKVRLDRVDRLEDGREVIIDYKSGKVTPASWIGERPDEPQLPLYAANHPGELAAVVFGQVRTGEAAFKGYAAADGLIPGAGGRDLAAEMAEWRRVLDRLGEDFRAGVANVDPKKPGTCRHCTLLALCRFSESEAPAAAFEAENGDA